MHASVPRALRHVFSLSFEENPPLVVERRQPYGHLHADPSRCLLVGAHLEGPSPKSFRPLTFYVALQAPPRRFHSIGSSKSSRLTTRFFSSEPAAPEPPCTNPVKGPHSTIQNAFRRVVVLEELPLRQLLRVFTRSPVRFRSLSEPLPHLSHRFAHACPLSHLRESRFKPL